MIFVQCRDVVDKQSATSEIAGKFLDKWCTWTPDLVCSPNEMAARVCHIKKHSVNMYV